MSCQSFSDGLRESKVACLPVKGGGGLPAPRFLEGHRRLEVGDGYFVDIVSSQRRVIWRDANGRQIWSLEGAPPDPNTLNYPVAAVFVATAGVLHVLDRGWGCVHGITRSGRWLGRWGGQDLEAPRGMVLSPSGDFYISDAAQRQILRFSSAGRLLGRFGEGEVYGPGALALDHKGVLHVVDTSLGCVHRYQIRSGRWLGYYAQNTWPGDIAVDQANLVWVTDATQGQLCCYHASGRALFQMALTQGKSVSLDASPQGRLSVVELRD